MLANKPVSLSRGCKRTIRVSAGGLDQGVAGLDSAALLGLLNHPQGDAVLDAAAGIEQLRLCVDIALDSQALGDLVEPDKGRVADEVGGREDGRGIAPDLGDLGIGHGRCW